MPLQNPKKGDIYHVPFPKPVDPHFAVVISANAINDNSEFVVVALITSKRSNEIAPHQFKVPKDILSQPSKIKCDNVFMLPKAELKPKAFQGSVTGSDMRGLDAAICKTFDIW